MMAMTVRSSTSVNAAARRHGIRSHLVTLQAAYKAASRAIVISDVLGVELRSRTFAAVRNARPRACHHATTSHKTTAGTTAVCDPQWRQPNLFLGLQTRDHAEIFQRCRITFDATAGGDFLQNAAHDFSTAGLGEGGSEANGVGLRQ